MSLKRCNAKYTDKLHSAIQVFASLLLDELKKKKMLFFKKDLEVSDIVGQGKPYLFLW